MKRAMKNRRKGMTLIELIVGFALVAILSASLVGIIAPVYRTYQRTRAVSDAEALAGNIIDAIRTSANSASVLGANENNVIVGVVRYSVSNGQLVYDVMGSEEAQKPVFDEKYYNGKTITMEANQPSTAENTVQVTIKVTTRDGVTVSQTGVISTLRQYIAGSHSELEAPGGGGTGGGGGETPGGGGPVTPGTGARGVITTNARDELERAWNRKDTADFIWTWIDTPAEYFDYFYFSLTNLKWLDHNPPAGKIQNLLTQGELQKLEAAARNAGKTNAAAMYSDMQNDKEKTTLGVYYTQNYSGGGENSIPIVYVTPIAKPALYTNPAGSTRSPYAAMYFIYYNNTWYIRNPDNYNADADWAVSFDGKSDSDIVTYLNSKTDYWKLDELQIPKK